ncbi:MAG: hypothetical protein WBA93_02295 [Microcoleaceae cyanobacterium]
MVHSNGRRSVGGVGSVGSVGSGILAINLFELNTNPIKIGSDAE